MIPKYRMNELKGKLKKSKQPLKVLWDWIKHGDITFKEFEALPKPRKRLLR